MRNALIFLITLLLAVILLFAGCNIVTGAGEPASETIGPVFFHSEKYNIEVLLPSGWAVAEGPISLKIPRSEGLISFNSWGQDDFWTYAIQGNNPDGSVSLRYGPGEVASQIKEGGAYVALEMTSGPPYAQDSQPTEYTLDDLSGLYQPHDWRQDSSNWAYFKTFHKNDSDLTLVISCHKDASDETIDQLNELLRSWRFTTTETSTASPTATTHSGIIVSPSVESPWPEVPAYKYPGEGNIIKIGDEISMGLDVTPRLGQYWKANYDESYLTLEDEQVVYIDPLSPVTGTTWFRFKAIKEGNTFIYYELISVSQMTLMSFTFHYFITE